MKVKFSVRIAHFLLPWLKEFQQEEMEEKNIEAIVQGIVIAMSVFGYPAYLHGCSYI
jgi:hypothetical protein